jgi:hypothetical protein
MTDSHAALMAAPGDVRQLAGELARDLASVSGQLSEIETCWRRVQATTHGVPAERLLRLEGAVRQIEADIRSLAEADREQGTGLALSAAGRFGMLRADMASARAMTQAEGIPVTGDAELWNSVADELHRAGTRLLRLVLAVAAVTNWSVNRTPPPGASKPWLLIELG